MEVNNPIPTMSSSSSTPLEYSSYARRTETGAPKLLIKRLSTTAVLPSKGSAYAAGYDLSASQDAVVPARDKALIKTDLAIAIPYGTYGRIAPRSGLTVKNGIDVGAGVADADYKGPLGVVLFNHSDTAFTIKVGDRIAQLILERIIPDAVIEEVEALPDTVRGEGGFGSTGVSVEPPTKVTDEVKKATGRPTKLKAAVKN